MKTYHFTISAPGCFLDGTNVSRRAGSETLAALHIRGVISRMKNPPADYQLSYLPKP